MHADVCRSAHVDHDSFSQPELSSCPYGWWSMSSLPSLRHVLGELAAEPSWWASRMAGSWSRGRTSSSCASPGGPMLAWYSIKGLLRRGSPPSVPCLLLWDPLSWQAAHSKFSVVAPKLFFLMCFMHHGSAADQPHLAVVCLPCTSTTLQQARLRSPQPWQCLRAAYRSDMCFATLLLPAIRPCMHPLAVQGLVVGSSLGWVKCGRLWSACSVLCGALAQNCCHVVECSSFVSGLLAGNLLKCRKHAQWCCVLSAGRRHLST